jgi:hypothetical protein
MGDGGPPLDTAGHHLVDARTADASDARTPPRDAPPPPDAFVGPDPARPRLIAPLSTATVTTQSPTLR